MFRKATITVALLFTFAASARADIVWTTNQVEWEEMAGSTSQINFTGYPFGTIVTNQYSDFGVTFTSSVFINQGVQYADGWGLFGEDGISFEFDTPHHAVAVDYVGAVSFALYDQGSLVGTIGFFADIPGPFVGIISDEAFDEVQLFKPWPPFSNNIISLDTLYWGMPVPAPGAIALFGIAFLRSMRSRPR